MSPEDFHRIVEEYRNHQRSILEEALTTGKHFVSMIIISPNDKDDGKPYVRSGQSGVFDEEDIEHFDQVSHQMFLFQQKYAKRDGFDLEVGRDPAGGMTIQSVDEEPNHSEPSSN